MPDQPLAVLLRQARPGADGNDPYEHALRSIAYPATCQPVLAFDLQDPRALRVLLQRPARYDALICTSPRAGRALQEILPPNHKLYASWTAKPTYVTGPRTATVIDAWGGQPVGQEAGNATALARRIIADTMADTMADTPASLLFLSGNRRRNTLPQALTEAGCPFDEVEVYRTRIRTDLSLPDPPATLVFFSPSGVEAVQRSGYDLSAYPCAAIGTTTAAALRAGGASGVAVAPTPTPEGVQAALQEM